MHQDDHSYKVKSALLFIIFNRPHATNKVFEQIRAVKPNRIYIAADGPRANTPNEGALCEQTREIINKIDWPCEAKSLLRNVNLGCKEAVSSAIEWFFEYEEEGIILEDDCLPNQSFFRFCDELLDKYRFNEQVRHIGGNNFQHGKKLGDGSYYFSHLCHIWGWATWKRVWKDYDKRLTKYTEADALQTLTSLFDNDVFIVTQWMQIFRDLKAGRIDTWDYQLIFLSYFKNGLCIIPNVNLVSNIGFGSGATHTTNADNSWANMPTIDIDELTHPTDFTVQKQADIDTLKEQMDTTVIPKYWVTKTIKRWHRSIKKRLNKWKKPPQLLVVV